MRRTGTGLWLGGIAGLSALTLVAGSARASAAPVEQTAPHGGRTSVEVAQAGSEGNARWRETAPSNTPQPTPERAREIVAPLYDALNRPATKDVDALLLKSTTDDFTSCANENECGDRTYLAERFKRFGRIMPDLRWDITDVWVTGDKVFVLGQASGTPIAPLFGAAPTGRSFKTMSLDMFIIRGDRMSFSYHVENWLSAIQQISGK